ncbi:hypothetical protein BESB_017120 [Besnoitia besnoiti]|uniref:Uncharacterized protein n=1 Tax=Besnoitia besnoiti TaxID=94643 RepID=A0A2A9M5B5_BESBE|nr:hypothetical protein BESB_017120 [Besnoitia besnoiti]PFH32394.1 hypothetical protein BESB_017120 [Besnoitia besnoiti]
MTDVSPELAKVEETRKNVEKELREIREVENRIRDLQLEQSEQKKEDDEGNIRNSVVSHAKLLADALNLYAGGEVSFDQDLVAETFRDSEQPIQNKATSILFRWLEKTDESSDENVKHQNLNTLRATLAVMSGLRKHKWVELVMLRKRIRESFPSRDNGEEEPVEKRNRRLKHVDDFLVILERLRRLHWKEIEYLDDFGLHLHRGAFPDDDDLQTYLYSSLLDRVQTYSGRYGFHNRSISTLDQIRRYYMDLRATSHMETNAVLWEDVRLALSAYDEYKVLSYADDLEKGVAAGLWPQLAVPLFLY